MRGCNVNHILMLIVSDKSCVQPTHCSLGCEFAGAAVGCPDLGRLVRVLAKQCGYSEEVGVFPCAVQPHVAIFISRLV